MSRTHHFLRGLVYREVGDAEDLERFHERSDQIDDAWMPGPDTPSPYVLKNPPRPKGQRQ